MTIHRLSAGSGYRYLTRTTARGDTDHAPSASAQSLTAYYTATGTPPGRWHGTGLTGLADGAGIPAGTVVDEKAMAALFGTGHDPVTGTVLGKAYPQFRTALERVAARMARLPAGLTLEQRATLSEQFTAEETARPARAAVAGFDLTFTAPKSVSVLWALADPATQAEIVAAHHAAVADTLTVLESTALFTRIGAGSCAQVTTGGAIAAAFDHPDTRTGDPNLHTHLVLANKVQGPDGAWRSVDSRALFTAAVALSETYDSLIADHLTRRLALTWQWRDRGTNRSPAHELTAIGDDLLTTFSTRSAAITTTVARMIRDHEAATGTRPTRRHVLQMRQQATLDTRPDKTTTTLPEQMTTWRERATTLLGEDGVTDLLHAALTSGRSRAGGMASGPSTLLSSADLDDAAVASLAGDVLAALIERRSTWTRWNTLAETARTTRHLRLATTEDRLTLHNRVATAALAACTRIDPADPLRVPTAYQRPDGASVFSRAGTTRYTHPLVLAAEHRLLDAHADATAPTAIPDDEPTRQLPAADPVGTEAVPAQRAPGRPALAADQAGAVRIACRSGRRLEVLIGPAGSGKTTTLRALRQVWERSHGHGSVIGLAPSASAARTLADSLGIPCENTAKWLYESTPHLDGRPTPTWRMRAGQLVIIDEASLASTATLDALTSQARTADAKLLLVGDHHQLGPVDAGGAFALLADDGHPLHLDTLWRFTHPWEAHATNHLRDGNPDILNLYDQHGRLHDGPYEQMIDAAYTAWTTDQATGATSVLLAHDRRTVAALNHRARTDRIDAGDVTPDGITTRHGTTLGIGDIVITRRNDRRHPLPATGDHVRNGMLWTLTDLHPDGSATLTTRTSDPEQRQSVRLPADYVSRHLDLGYAVTIHRAQGLTVDTAHVLTNPGMTREHLYVALTRGRHANHAYTPTDHPDQEPAHEPDAATSGLDVLRQILATPGTEPSATTAQRAAAAEIDSPDRLRPIATTLAADITRRRWTRLLTDHTPALAHHLEPTEAAGALYAALARAETAGHNPSEILTELTRATDRQIASPEPPTEATDLAHRLRQHIDAWNDETGEVSTVDPRDPLAVAITTDPNDPAAPVLDDVRRLVEHRTRRALAHHWHPSRAAGDAIEPIPDLASPATPQPQPTGASR